MKLLPCCDPYEATPACDAYEAIPACDPYYIYIAANSCSASCCSLANAKLVNSGDQPERQDPAIYVDYYARTYVPIYIDIYI